MELGFWTPQTNVIVIPPDKPKIEDYTFPINVLVASKTLNFVIPYVHEKSFIGLYQGDVLDQKVKIIGMTTDTDKLFSDKFVDMKGYVYTVIIHKHDKRLVQKDDNYLLPQALFLETVARKQNASVYKQFSTIEKTDDIDDFITHGKVDMILNLDSFSSLLINKNFFKTVNTYETNGFCTMVPISSGNEMFLKFIIKPFSNCVWLVLVFLITFGALVWHGFQKFTGIRIIPGLYFISDVLLAFIQQSVNIRRGQLVPKVMLQIFIFMMIIIANVYQGTITSILMDPKQFQKFENIQELLNTEYDIYTDILFQNIIKKYDTNQLIVDRIVPLSFWLHDSNYTKQFQDVMSPKNVLIVACDMVQELLETQIDDRTKGIDVYYELHQKMLPYFESILLSRRSPFHEKLNEMSLRIYESGIKQHWTMLMGKFKRSRSNIDDSMLGMNEMKLIFKTYLHGILTSIIVFLLEIFKNSLRIIYRRWIKKCLRKIQMYIHRRVKPRIQKV